LVVGKKSEVEGGGQEEGGSERREWCLGIMLEILVKVEVDMTQEARWEVGSKG